MSADGQTRSVLDFYDELENEIYAEEPVFVDLEELPPRDKEIDVTQIKKRLREMPEEERKDLPSLVQDAFQELLHEEVFGTRFHAHGVEATYHTDKPTNSLRGGFTELRISTSGVGLTEQMFKAFRTPTFTTGSYRDKFAKVLRHYRSEKYRHEKRQERRKRRDEKAQNLRGRLSAALLASEHVSEGAKNRIRSRAPRSGLSVERFEKGLVGQLKVQEGYGTTEKGAGLKIQIQDLSIEDAMDLLAWLDGAGFRERP